jgi:hypothetical protein
MQRVETTNKNLEIIFLDNLRGYCYEPSQHTGNRLVLNNISLQQLTERELGFHLVPK